MPRPKKSAGPFRYFNSSPEVIRLVVLMYVRFPLSLRNVEDLLFERGITPTSTTTSTSNATSSTEKPTRPAARSHWPSGSRSWPEACVIQGQLRRSETSCD